MLIQTRRLSHYTDTRVSSICRPSVLVDRELLHTAPAPDRLHIFCKMNTNQIPNIAILDPPSRGYSRYSAQTVPKIGVLYADNPSKTMVIASAQNAGGLQEVNNRPRNKLTKEYRNDRAPEAINKDGKELYNQVCTERERSISVTNTV